MADPISILDGLWKRQIGTCCYKNERISCKMLRSVILLPRSKFTPVWSKESQKHICIGLDRRMYFDNHHYCYYNDGFGGKPALCYQLDSQVFGEDLSHKILAVLLYHCHIVQSPRLPEEKDVCLLVLTADGYLKILGANSGAVLRSVFLSTAIRYKYLMWGSYLKTVQVKSIQSVSSPPSSGVGVANSSSCYLTIAVFKLHPLELLTCLPIQKRIFGEDIVDASVDNDLLVLTHRNGVVKMYSLPWIIKHCTMLAAPLGRFVELPREAGLGGIRAGAVGNPGFGIPWTVKLTECPPLLFETKTSAQASGVSFGGHPTVFLHSSPKSSNQFLLTSLQDKKPITVLETSESAFHSDTAEFHSDDNRRVLQVSNCSLSCYRLVYDETKKTHELLNKYSIDFRGDLNDITTPVRTASGRVVKRRYSSLNFDSLYASAIQDVDYENETDLLYAVVTLPDPSSDHNMQCNLHFIDERNGSVLKSVPLPTWGPDGDNSIYYELDCILHLRRNSYLSSNFTCYYYRLE